MSYHVDWGVYIMRLLKLVLTVGFAMSCEYAYAVVQNIQDENEELSDWDKYVQPHREKVPIDLQFLGRSVFGLDFANVASYVLPKAKFFYQLYNRAQGDEAIFVNLV